MIQPKSELSPFFVSVLSLVTENDRTAEEIYASYKDRLQKNPFSRIVGSPVRFAEIENTLLYLVKEEYVQKSLTNFIFEPLPEEVKVFRLTKKGSDVITSKK